ncbi:winged helix-turn-helix domain-containing protein [Kitasatospora aureofaciens]|uniref:BTAD domain-containing putative transcriptional regulator n=1 Tax=Kitasatospora aureofaciens TaxID=1894 RepID=UPI001C45B209|nr:BTAD domain-containing putative transcriptional regulator [Kitasatospora aureofaciens]MBV6701715.1 winged helix-turn-helix domain-containing protein [Kitasatospora aureofaciens]
MPTTATASRPSAAVLGYQERKVLHAVGCGLRDDEIAATLAISEDSVAGHLARILVKLGLRDRAAAIVHAFDCGLVAPGGGPRAQVVRPVLRSAAGRAAGPKVQISVLGPLRAWQDGRSLNLGHLRQQAVLAALALRGGRTVSQQELLDGVWGLEAPVTNVVPVHIYRLRKTLRIGDSPDSVIEHDRCGYRLVSGAAEVDLARMENLVTDAGTAHRAGEPAEAVRLCAQALDLFRGELLAGLPGPLAELERLRLAERRIAVAQRKLEWQLRLGQYCEAIAELFALSAEHPLNEPVAAMLMRALYRSGRQADALAVFDRARRRLADDLRVPPSRMLRRTHQMILRGDEAGLGLTGATR